MTILSCLIPKAGFVHFCQLFIRTTNHGPSLKGFKRGFPFHFVPSSSSNNEIRCSCTIVHFVHSPCQCCSCPPGGEFNILKFRLIASAPGPDHVCLFNSLVKTRNWTLIRSLLVMVRTSGLRGYKIYFPVEFVCVDTVVIIHREPEEIVV
jgi:hypothetical protein